MSTSLHVIGLTGGIATGKSAVANVLREQGIPVLDADSLGHLVLAPGQPAYDQAVALFGRDILHETSPQIDRKRLGKKVFADEDLRRKLEAITHPEIAKMALKGLQLIEARGEKRAVYEAALLVETGIYKSMKYLVVVDAPLEEQLTRLCKRDHIEAREAATKIATQLPAKEKRAVADYIIENNGTVDHLIGESIKLADLLKEKFS